MARRLLQTILGGFAVIALGCGGTATPPPSMPATSDATWTDGTSLIASLEIPAGMTYTIAPGAHVTAGSKVSITIRGTLKVASATGMHARITSMAGAPWTGLVVENGGTLDADGLDLENASAAIDVRAGAAAARYDDGTIKNPLFPFQIGRAGRLDTAHASVVGAMSASTVSGEFHASYLDYAKTQTTGGFVMSDALAVFDVADSTFHGEPGTQGADYITTLGATLVHVTYTTITDSHCAFHFDGLDRYEIDHVTAGASAPDAPGQKNAWGAMLYGSGAGPNVIKSSNFMNLEHNLDQSGENGPLTITDTYTTGMNLDNDDSWTLTGSELAPSPVLDAKPR
ncbi:MAG TPA: hypothetical protein VHJ20_00785 [Polyangia bacterium]|nr:hypothetical protein [Polyangia bacterium]